MSVDTNKSDLLVNEVASYSDDASSSVEPPLASDDDASLVPADGANGEKQGNGGGGPVQAIRLASQPPPGSFVAARLKEANKGYVKNMYRSSDLVPLEEDFETFKKHLRMMLSTAKVYNDATEQLEGTRTKLFRDYASLSKNTPLAPFVNEGRGSLASVQELATMYQAYNTQEYHQQILGYLNDWQDTVSAQVEAKISILPKLRDTREHYQTKLDSIRAKIEKLEEAEKSVPQTTQERLERTEEKLGIALTAHEAAASKACFLIEQIMKCAWKDLYPLVNRMMKWELNKLGREEKSYGQHLPATIEQIDQKTENVHLDYPTAADEEQAQQQPSGPQSFYGTMHSISDYMDYLPSDLPHLFLDDACPFSQRTWITFLEKENDPYNPTLFQLHRVCSYLGPKDPGYRLLNQLGGDSIEDGVVWPVLIHNGNVFRDSTGISEYIDGCFEHEEKPLCPLDPVDNFNMSLFLDRHASIADLYFQLLEKGNSSSSSSSNSNGSDDEEGIDLTSALMRLLLEINTDLQKIPGPYLCGHHFTLADICLFPFVERMKVVLSHYYGRTVEINPFLSFLHTWYAKVASRRSVQITMADRTITSMSTSAFKSQSRKEYLVEYSEPCVNKEVSLAKDLFQQYGVPGENAYRDHRADDNNVQQQEAIANGAE